MFKLFITNKYKTVFNRDNQYREIENILKNNVKKINYLEEYSTLITDIFYSIYKGTNLEFNDFINRLESRLTYIGILNKSEMTSFIQGSYSSKFKAIKISPELLLTELEDFNSKDFKELNNYKLIRTLLHESIHCIANNNFAHNKDIIESKYLDIYNELMTIQFEYKIYNKYFKDCFLKGELINNSLNLSIEYYNESEHRTYYGSENKVNYEGYLVINKLASYIELINENISKCFLGKEDILKSSLNNEIYEDFSQKALKFIKNINQYHRINNLNLYETIESFYRTIDYGIKEELIDKETYLKLKEQILSSESFVFKEIDTNKEFIKNGEIINFDIYFLNKIEEENYKKLKIDENINKENQYKVEEHFESIDFKPNINSLEANITIDRTL